MPEIQEMTGFQSACAEYAEDRLTLDGRYITNPPAMYPVRVGSDIPQFGLRKDDELIVDRSLEPKTGELVIAVIGNRFLIAKFAYQEGAPYLLPYNKKVGDNELGEDFVWGVIASIHRRMRK